MIEKFDQTITLLSGIAFIIYGYECIFSKKMVLEFERYHLSKYRKLTGLLEILGGIGSIAGLFWLPLLALSSLGLFVLMILGLATRFRIKDSFREMIPALLLLMINLRILLVVINSFI
jgi:hypothetical protein